MIKSTISPVADNRSPIFPKAYRNNTNGGTVLFLTFRSGMFIDGKYPGQYCDNLVSCADPMWEPVNVVLTIKH